MYSSRSEYMTNIVLNLALNMNLFIQLLDTGFIKLSIHGLKLFNSAFILILARIVQWLVQHHHSNPQRNTIFSKLGFFFQDYIFWGWPGLGGKIIPTRSKKYIQIINKELLIKNFLQSYQRWKYLQVAFHFGIFCILSPRVPLGRGGYPVGRHRIPGRSAITVSDARFVPQITTRYHLQKQENTRIAVWISRHD